VPSVKYKGLRGPASSEDSAAVRVRVTEARQRQCERWRRGWGFWHARTTAIEGGANNRGP